MSRLCFTRCCCCGGAPCMAQLSGWFAEICDICHCTPSIQYRPYIAAMALGTVSSPWSRVVKHHDTVQHAPWSPGASCYSSDSVLVDRHRVPVSDSDSILTHSLCPNRKNHKPFTMRIIIKGGVWRNTEDEILKAAISKSVRFSLFIFFSSYQTDLGLVAVVIMT